MAVNVPRHHAIFIILENNFKEIMKIRAHNGCVQMFRSGCRVIGYAPEFKHSGYIQVIR